MKHYSKQELERFSREELIEIILQRQEGPEEASPEADAAQTREPDVCILNEAELLSAGRTIREPELSGVLPAVVEGEALDAAQLAAVVLNAKYNNAASFARISEGLAENGVELSAETLAVWTVWLTQTYLYRIYDSIRIATSWQRIYELFAELTENGIAGTVPYALGEQAMQRIDALYMLDQQSADASPAQRLAERQETMAPLVDGFLSWLEAQLTAMRTSPDGAGAPRGAENGAGADAGAGAGEESFVSYEYPKAASLIVYCLKNKEALRAFLSDASLPLDLRKIEKRIAAYEKKSRHRWRFAELPSAAESRTEEAVRAGGAESGPAAQTLAASETGGMLYSIVSMARAYELNVYEYLSRLLRELPKRTEGERTEDLAPWSAALPY